MGDSLLLEADSLEISCIQPRAKVNVRFCEKGLTFRDHKDESFAISSIRHFIVFPKPEDCRIKGKTSVSDMVLLVLTDNVSYKNKKVQQLCFQLPVGTPSWKNGCSSKEDDATASWVRLLATSLHFSTNAVIRVHNPRTTNKVNAFCSHLDNSTSTTVSGMPFVSCYHGVNDGVLFPLETGLLFFKPPLFLHRSTLHSVDSATGSNRYLTLTVAVTDEDNNDEETSREFTNIHKQEHTVLQKYIHGTLIPAMQQDIDSNTNGAGASKSDEDDNDEPERGAVEAVNSTANMNRQKRKAGAEAATVNKRIQLHQGEEESEDDDDDDDEDYTLEEEAGHDDDSEADSDTDDDESGDDDEVDNDAHATGDRDDDDDDD